MVILSGVSRHADDEGVESWFDPPHAVCEFSGFFFYFIAKRQFRSISSTHPAALGGGPSVNINVPPSQAGN